MGKKTTKQPVESFESKQLRAGKIFDVIKKTYPEAECALNHSSAFQLLIATILAAQCTDVKVNEISPALFKKYPTPTAFAECDLEALEREIKPTGFFHNKAKNIKNCCLTLLDKFKGKVPKTMDELTSLPGVGRKTANVILGNFYGLPAIIVDTHVLRLSGRLGLSKETEPEKVEIDLQKLLPPEKWTDMSNCLVFHGRYCCNARKPNCAKCPIFELCTFTEKII